MALGQAAVFSACILGFSPNDSAQAATMVSRADSLLASIKAMEHPEQPYPLVVRLDSVWIFQRRPLATLYGLTSSAGDTIAIHPRALREHRLLQVLSHELWHAFAYRQWEPGYCRRYDEAGACWFATRLGFPGPEYPDADFFRKSGFAAVKPEASCVFGNDLTSFSDSAVVFWLHSCRAPEPLPDQLR